MNNEEQWDEEFEERVALGLLLSREFEPARHPLQTDKCPSIPQYERLARRLDWNLERLRHVNGCSYCQLNLQIFRQELDIKPLWETLQAAWQRACEGLRQSLVQFPLEAAGDNSIRSICLVPARMISDSQGVAETFLELMTLRFVARDQALRLRLRMAQPAELEVATPLELTVVAHAESRPVGSFLLPDLMLGREEEFKMRLPEDLLEAWCGIEQAAAKRCAEGLAPDLPFRFVLQPASGQLENDAASD